MKKTYRTALGKQVDMDHLRLTNEEVIAVGNMKVNARGDELGPNGTIVRTRNEVMSEYYNTQGSVIKKEPVSALSETQAIKQAQAAHEQRTSGQRPRGSAARRVLEDQDGVE